MCGRFTLSSPGDVLAEMFELIDVPELTPRYNIAPTQTAPAIRVTPEASERRLDALHWGLIPFWAKDPAIGARMINARAETVAEKPAFRTAFRKRRCLVIADGFYEWKKIETGARGSRPRKQPHYIRMRDGRPFAFAGLWEHWEDPDGTAVDSCTILTTEPNELITPLHNRMPVILCAEDYGEWLDPDGQATEKLQRLLAPYPPGEMEAYPVSTRVNNPSHDAPDCIEP